MTTQTYAQTLAAVMPTVAHDVAVAAARDMGGNIMGRSAAAHAALQTAVPHPFMTSDDCVYAARTAMAAADAGHAALLSLGKFSGLCDAALDAVYNTPLDTPRPLQYGDDVNSRVDGPLAATVHAIRAAYDTMRTLNEQMQQYAAIMAAAAAAHDSKSNAYASVAIANATWDQDNRPASL